MRLSWCHCNYEKNNWSTPWHQICFAAVKEWGSLSLFACLPSLQMLQQQTEKPWTFKPKTREMQQGLVICRTYVLHCQSLALKRPRLFSAKVFPISVPPAFIILASTVFSVEQNTMASVQQTSWRRDHNSRKQCCAGLTSSTSVTTSSSGKVHVPTPANTLHLNSCKAKGRFTNIEKI